MNKGDLLRDGVGFTGCGLISFGAWLAYEPAGFIVAGLALIGLAVLSGRR